MRRRRRTVADSCRCGGVALLILTSCNQQAGEMRREIVQCTHALVVNGWIAKRNRRTARQRQIRYSAAASSFYPVSLSLLSMLCSAIISSSSSFSSPLYNEEEDDDDDEQREPIPNHVAIFLLQ